MRRTIPSTSSRSKSTRVIDTPGNRTKSRSVDTPGIGRTSTTPIVGRRGSDASGRKLKAAPIVERYRGKASARTIRDGNTKAGRAVKVGDVTRRRGGSSATRIGGIKVDRNRTTRALNPKGGIRKIGSRRPSTRRGSRYPNRRRWNAWYCERPYYRYNRYCYRGFSSSWLWCDRYWPQIHVTTWFPGYFSFCWGDYWTRSWLDTWHFGYVAPTYILPVPYACYITSLPVDDAVDEDASGAVEEIVAEPAPRPAIPSAERTTEATLATYYVELADLYFETGRYARAAEAYARAVRLVPDDGSLRLVLADAWIAIGDYGQAAYSIRKGIELDPDLAAADIDRREAYGDKADFEKHLAALRKRVAEREFDTSARLCLAVTLRFSRAPAEARIEFEALLKLMPSDPTAKVFLSALDS